jgi:hypothetical protein
VLYILNPSRQQIIQAEYFMAFSDEPVTQMGSQEASAAGDNR